MMRMVLALIVIVAGYVTYRTKYRIDEKFYTCIVDELAERGQLTTDQGISKDAG